MSTSNATITANTKLHFNLTVSSPSCIMASAPPSAPVDVLRSKYPAKAHFHKVLDYLHKLSSTTSTIPSTKAGVIYLEASKSKLWPNSDQEAPIRQDRFFYYLSGCELPDTAVIYDLSTLKSTLFLPPLNPDEVVWSGLPLPEKEALATYDVDEVRTANEIPAILSSAASVFAIEGRVSPDASLPGDSSRTNLLALREAIEESRVVKDQYEIALIRRANEVSAIAHKAVFQAARSSSTEAQLEARFVGACIAHGCRKQAYDPIMASGEAAATLHYVANNKPLAGKLNMLVDAGAEYRVYAADVTRTFPISGKFTKESREIYDIVLGIQETVIGRLKAGVKWDECQALAHEMVVDGLLKVGILKGPKKDIMHAQTSTAFLPHGLGHYLGMDTHDTGGHPNYNDAQPMYKYLRVRGELPAGSVITVEPGIYFCRFIIEPFLKDEKHGKFIDEKVLEKYWSVGGVRIEDDVLVTENGHENLTSVPKAAAEIEALMAAA